MAIIKLGVLVTGIRGLVEGNVFSRNLSGPYIRGWCRGANPRSRGQSTHRSAFSGQGGPWRSLTDQQRTDWADYAAAAGQVKVNSLGEEYYASGWNWFVEINTARALVGDAWSGTVPVAAVPGIPVFDSLTLEIDGTDVTAELEYQNGVFGATDAAVIWAAFVPGGGRRVMHSGYYVVAADDDPPATALEFGAAVKERWGVPQVGDQLFVQGFIQNSEGRRGAAGTIFAAFEEAP